MTIPLINTCDECGSAYYRASSKMDALCPNCAHVLYGYEACLHTLSEGRCVKCYWDGSTSAFVKQKRVRQNA